LPSDSTGNAAASLTSSEALQAVLKPGRQLVAAGYALYSSATVLVVAPGPGLGAHGFVLDRLSGEFVLTHERIQVPQRGQIYSLNDARRAATLWQLPSPDICLVQLMPFAGIQFV
jgi:fructose-1,6-bisphosphatase